MHAMKKTVNKKLLPPKKNTYQLLLAKSKLIPAYVTNVYLKILFLGLPWWRSG